MSATNSYTAKYQELVERAKNKPYDFSMMEVWQALFDAEAALKRHDGPQGEELLRRALTGFCDAFTNRGETTSLREWNERMKVAHGDALEALAGREPYASPSATSEPAPKESK